MIVRGPKVANLTTTPEGAAYDAATIESDSAGPFAPGVPGFIALEVDFSAQVSISYVAGYRSVLGFCRIGFETTVFGGITQLTCSADLFLKITSGGVPGTVQISPASGFRFVRIYAPPPILGDAEDARGWIGGAYTIPAASEYIVTGYRVEFNSLSAGAAHSIDPGTIQLFRMGRHTAAWVSI